MPTLATFALLPTLDEESARMPTPTPRRIPQAARDSVRESYNCIEMVQYIRQALPYQRNRVAGHVGSPLDWMIQEYLDSMVRWLLMQDHRLRWQTWKEAAEQFDQATNPKTGPDQQRPAACGD